MSMGSFRTGELPLSAMCYGNVLRLRSVLLKQPGHNNTRGPGLIPLHIAGPSLLLSAYQLLDPALVMEIDLSPSPSRNGPNNR